MIPFFDVLIDRSTHLKMHLLCDHCFITAAGSSVNCDCTSG